jgi:hypothetical protein
MPAIPPFYAARLDVDYPQKLNRLTTLVRPILIIPIYAVVSLLLGGGGFSYQISDNISFSLGGTEGIAVATAIMIIFKKHYPRWWFDFEKELARFSARIAAYLLLLTDQYPSTVNEQAVHLEIDYPNAKRYLNRWLPLVKWILAIPHYIALTMLTFVAIFAVAYAWFAILITGRYPRDIFDLIVGIGRWSLRVHAYAFLLVTDQYPPFSLS